MCIIKMSDGKSNICLTWQLVSQFVSWEFCRYISEQREKAVSDIDVLTYFRNMIVKRSEKSVCDITKHEIIAKFIMEIKCIKNLSGMPCIVELSKRVIKICPELENAARKLIHHMEVFYNVINCNEELIREELIRERINDAINEFSKEAGTLLPQPDLLQVVRSWKQHCDCIKEKKLCEKVLECLYIEKITQSEAKQIAVSLYEDKAFEKILFDILEDPEPDNDSDKFSQSLQSSLNNEYIYSQEFAKDSQQSKIDDIPPYLLPCNSDHRELDTPAVDESNSAGNIPRSPPHLVRISQLIESSSSSKIDSSNELHCLYQPDCGYDNDSLKHGNIENKGNSYLENRSHEMQFAVESDSNEECDLLPRINTKFSNNLDEHSIIQTDSDTSDCEKYAEYRFLTPTLYKDANKPTVPQSHLSDWSSNDSSNVTTQGTNSQRNDPNWTLKARSKPEGKNVRKISKKKPLLSSSNSDDDNDVENPGANGDDIESSIVDTVILKPPKRRCTLVSKTVKQLRSSDSSISEFCVIRKPVSIAPSAVTIRSAKRINSQVKKKSNKKHKCSECNQTFKSDIALRRHIFLEHTDVTNSPIE